MALFASNVENAIFSKFYIQNSLFSGIKFGKNRYPHIVRIEPKIFILILYKNRHNLNSHVYGNKFGQKLSANFRILSSKDKELF